MEHLKILLIFTILNLDLVTPLNSGQNLLVNDVINNSQDTQGWKKKERSSYWKVSEAGENLYQTENGCLCFKTTLAQSYFSQFISFQQETDSNQGLLMHASLGGTDTKNISINYYIRYTNGLLFKLSLQETDQTKQSKNIKTFIPKYGTIKTIAAFVISDEAVKDQTCVCDLTLKFSQTAIAGFPVYDRTFPIQRHVVPFYLIPRAMETKEDLNVITVATQLTIDRLNNLEKMTKRWKGPVSAAILVMGHQSDVSKIVNYYSSSDVLSRYVTLHLVFYDSMNGKDDILYPVNYLRNIALNYVRSRRVLLLDVDLIPGFTMTEAVQWIDEVGPEVCTKCAFVAPLYQVNHYSENLPSKKSELLDLLQKPDSPVSAFATSSHGVVNFKKWQGTNDLYQIQYKENIEPYFITDSNAPLVNDVFSGYGRDKCAYSRDVHSLGYQFHVLPKAFLMDVKHKNDGSQPRIYDRSKGVKLSMFLSIDFLEWEINQNHHIYRTYDNKLGAATNYNKGSCEEHQLQDGDELQVEYHWTSMPQEHDNPKDPQGQNENLTASMTPAEIPHAMYTPVCQTLLSDDIDISELPNMESLEYETRDDVIAERLIRRYQTGHVIIMPHETRTGLLGYLHFVHPDSVTIISPSEGPFQRSLRGQIEVLSGTGDVSTLLNLSREKNKGASLIFIISSNLVKANIIITTASAIQSMTKDDILVAVGEPTILLDALKGSTFCSSTNLQIFRLKIGFLIKPKDLQIKECPSVPKTPEISIEQCSSNPNLKTDVILMTRNRPMQTLAFLQSLSIMGSGISKVWVQYKADDEVFKSGYENAVACLSDSLDIELVDDKKDGFGKTLKSILTNSTADYVVLAVDEMVWLRPMDLNMAACLMFHQRDIASFQLRLGENIGVHRSITNKNQRIFPVRDPEDVSLFYPLRMPYDFGYVLNVDGTMMNISMLLEDFSGWLEHTNHPGELESRWMSSRSHSRVRQWHLMYRESRLVNNALNTDGRVIGQTTPVDGSFQLAYMMLKSKKQISISDFITANAMHSSTHISKDVVYEDLKCKI